MTFSRPLAALGLAVALAGCRAAPADSPEVPSMETAPQGERQELAFFSSLPILWSEGEVTDLLSADNAPHWARTAIERRFDLKPVDRLTSLSDETRLMMAQPRALAPDENVALDEWVRAGGDLLMFVDPMLTEHSEYGLGDVRRPQTLAMLSPILARWGLELLLPDLPEAEGAVDWNGTQVPVIAPGRFALAGDGHESDCTLSAQGLVASCRIGEGTALLVADAALLEGEHDHGGEHDEAWEQARESALSAFLARAFAGT